MGIAKYKLSEDQLIRVRQSQEENEKRQNRDNEVAKRKDKAKIGELEREIERLKEENANLRHYLKDIL